MNREGSAMTATIGDASRNGLYQITDTAHHSWFHGEPGQLRVTVREMVGQRLDDYPGGRSVPIRAMRDLARRAVDSPVGTELQRVWYSQGQSHATFIVTGDPFAGWTMASVGCHWSRALPDGRMVHMSTWSRGDRSGYSLTLDYNRTEYASLADALAGFDDLVAI